MKKRLSRILCAGLAGALMLSATPLNAYALTSKDVYNTLEAESLRCTEGVDVITEGNVTYLSGFDKDDYLNDTFDISKGVDAIEITYRADKASFLTISMDNFNGPKLASLRIDATNGQFVTKKFSITNFNDNKAHDLYFKCNLGQMDIDSLKFFSAEPIVRNGSAYDLNEAEYTHHHDDCEVKTEGDITYLAMEKQDTFSDRFDLNKGYKAIEITYRADKKASLTGRIFQSTGPAFAYLELAPTKGKFVTKTFEIPYPQDQNAYDLTFTCGKNNIDIDSFMFIPADEEEKVVTINPYELNEINKTISKDNSTVVENVDFSDGIDKFSIYGYTTDTYGIVQIYLDAPNSTEGTSIGGFSFEKGEIAKEYSQIHRLNISGVHNIYFVCTNDNANINLTAWKADKNFTHEIGKDPYKVVPITDYESLYASETITDSDTTFIALTDEKSRIFTYRYDCSNGLEGIRLTYKTDAPASIKVLDGAFNGESLGTIKLPGTNGKIETKLFRFNKIITGSHSLTFVGDVNTAYIASWQGVDPQTFVFPGPKNPVKDEPVEEEPVAETKGNTVECAVNSWGSGCSASLTVKNESDTTTNGWTIKIKKADFTIDACWCVNMEETDDYYIFTPLDWNKTLSAGQSLQFGFNASGNIPESIECTIE